MCAAGASTEILTEHSRVYFTSRSQEFNEDATYGVSTANERKLHVRINPVAVQEVIFLSAIGANLCQ
jgi:hypothetical protein